MKILCYHCNIEVEKNMSEVARAERLGRKLFCSLRCSVKQQQKDRHVKLVQVYNTNPTICDNCKTPLPYEKRRNRFCGQSCAAVVNNRHFPKREKTPENILREQRIAARKEQRNVSQTINHCKNCGTELTTRTQTYFCSQKCQAENISKESLLKVERGDKVGVLTLKRYLVEKRGNKCECCGWNKLNPITNKCPIELEHIDGNHENNSLDNLKLLCPNCHSLTPTYKNLNKGKGRFSRRKRYAEGKSY